MLNDHNPHFLSSKIRQPLIFIKYNHMLLILTRQNTNIYFSTFLKYQIKIINVNAQIILFQLTIIIIQSMLNQFKGEYNLYCLLEQCNRLRN